ncbi:hypothetical protein PanWU01x14_114650 [Parasponia andersonii]|uniref:Uncharacterized protein n=1 Tax=Parasponia andersonii TaxID=3476 RepID=A0A2P5CXE6_PARAD|nr:hypothetical protein PanWU01x14_114650 [Parasponia andersonii]
MKIEIEDITKCACWSYHSGCITWIGNQFFISLADYELGFATPASPFTSTTNGKGNITNRRSHWVVRPSPLPERSAATRPLASTGKYYCNHRVNGSNVPQAF